MVHIGSNGDAPENDSLSTQILHEGAIYSWFRSFLALLTADFVDYPEM